MMISELIAAWNPKCDNFEAFLASGYGLDQELTVIECSHEGEFVAHDTISLIEKGSIGGDGGEKKKTLLRSLVGKGAAQMKRKVQAEEDLSRKILRGEQLCVPSFSSKTPPPPCAPCGYVASDSSPSPAFVASPSPPRSPFFETQDGNDFCGMSFFDTLDWVPEE
jgi:hypothetical protein